MSPAAASQISIRVNDQTHALAPATSVADLLRELGLADKKGIALAINDTVVPRSTWLTRALNDGDRVLVIRATQGG